jgi:BMFP domain-containing protein YqiC
VQQATEDAVTRVRAALAANVPPARKDVERALRDCLGLSARQAKRFAAQGAKALGASDGDDEASNLLQRVKALESVMRP